MAKLERTITRAPRWQLEVKIILARRLRFRIWLAARLIGLAAWLLNAELVLSTEIGPFAGWNFTTGFTDERSVRTGFKENEGGWFAEASRGPVTVFGRGADEQDALDQVKKIIRENYCW